MDTRFQNDQVQLVLASASPRRKQLLEDAGYTLRVAPSHIEEPCEDGFDSPIAYVCHTAWLKANADAANRDLVLAADTVAVCDNQIIGKPVDRADADRILMQLAGTRHQVITGLCLRLSELRVCLTDYVTTTVVMKPLTEQERSTYLDTGLWEGKAGAYGIQDHDDPFVTAVEGSYTNVMGLPMERLAEMLKLAEAMYASVGGSSSV